MDFEIFFKIFLIRCHYDLADQKDFGKKNDYDDDQFCEDEDERDFDDSDDQDDQDNENDEYFN